LLNDWGGQMKVPQRHLACPQGKSQRTPDFT